MALDLMDFLLPLDTGQYGSDIVCRTPPILQYIQAQLARVVYIWMEHLTDELDSRRLIRVLLLEMHDQSKSAIFKRRVRRPDDDRIPISHTQTRSIRKIPNLSESEGSGTKISLSLVPAGEIGGGGGTKGRKDWEMGYDGERGATSYIPCHYVIGDR